MTRCHGCEFWREGQDHGSGECHAHAPRPVLAGQVKRGPGRIPGETWWPVTEHNDGCREGRPYPGAIQYTPAPELSWWRRLLGGRR